MKSFDFHTQFLFTKSIRNIAYQRCLSYGHASLIGGKPVFFLENMKNAVFEWRITFENYICKKPDVFCMWVYSENRWYVYCFVGRCLSIYF